jgi:uncharacterized protein (DUF1501 family)
MNYPMNRRHFLKHAAAVGAAANISLANNLYAAAPLMKAKGKHLIVLWMGGGYTHLDTFGMNSRLVGQPTQGEFNPIKCEGTDLEISEVLPETAKQMKHGALIYTLNTREGDHGRGTYRVSHGKPPEAAAIGIKVPGIGSVVGHYAGSDSNPIPRVVSVGSGQTADQGFFDAACANFPVPNAGQVPPNMSLPQMGNSPQETTARGMRRQGLLNVLENNFKFGLTPHITSEKDRKAVGDAAQMHSELVSNAFQVSMKTGRETFEFNAADNALLAKFGNNGFGRGALLATKLVKAGVSSVEIGLGGWDLHNDVFNTVRNQRGPTMDNAIGSLIGKLNDEGLLKDTVVVLMSEFGRTPNINQNTGRDHWGGSWTTAIWGGNIKGGTSVGVMNPDHRSIKSDPVSTEQLHSTIYRALDIDIFDVAAQPHDNLGRRFYVAGDKENAKHLEQIVK